MLAIEIKGLTKKFGDFKAISDVNLSVNKGEIFGFIGPNGSGKSTTIRTLLGLLKESSGEMRIQGQDVKIYGDDLRAKIGYLPSEVNYYEEMDSRELLTYSAGFYDNVDLSKIDTLAEYLELDLNKKITDLSFGNKKKCAIIQCLLHSPEILILDEPTSGLDPLMQNRFFELLEQENKKGATIFFSSHILSEIQRMCERAAVIKEGKIITVEKIQTLLEKQLKRVELVFKTIPNSIDYIDGIDKINQKGNRLSFQYTGEINHLIHWISQFELFDAVLKEPNLESIFMNYYER
jgi:ABC-2 type transport system ATP-binding protein